MDGIEGLEPDEAVLWRAVGRLVHVLPRRLDADMVAAAGMAMTEFAVLNNLVLSPEGSLRMAELAGRTAMSASRMTRVVDDLALRGLVRKERAVADGRGSVAVLTGAGREAHAVAAPQFLASARRRVLDHVPAEHVALLGRVLAAVADGAAGSVEAPRPRTTRRS